MRGGGGVVGVGWWHSGSIRVDAAAVRANSAAAGKSEWLGLG